MIARRECRKGRGTSGDVANGGAALDARRNVEDELGAAASRFLELDREDILD